MPVRVQAWFWLTVGLSAAARQTGDALIWIGVCFVSILVHELGHVAAFRLFGVRAHALLYVWGGMAIPEPGWRRNARLQAIVSLAGPAAGFGVAAVVAAAAKMTGAQFLLGSDFYVIPSVSSVLSPSVHALSHLQSWNVLLNDLLCVNLYWGLVNLLPVFPLDGGQVLGAILDGADPVRGRRRTLIGSALVAAAMASVGLLERKTYVIVLFGCLAVANATELLAPKPVSSRPTSCSWRDGSL